MFVEKLQTIEGIQEELEVFERIQPCKTYTSRGLDQRKLVSCADATSLPIELDNRVTEANSLVENDQVTTGAEFLSNR